MVARCVSRSHSRTLTLASSLSPHEPNSSCSIPSLCPLYVSSPRSFTRSPTLSPPRAPFPRLYLPRPARSPARRRRNGRAVASSAHCPSSCGSHGGAQGCRCSAFWAGPCLPCSSAVRCASLSSAPGLRSSSHRGNGGNRTTRSSTATTIKESVCVCVCMCVIEIIV